MQGANTTTQGYAQNAEQFAPQAEDNTNAILAVCEKPLATNTYAPSLYTNFGTVTKANIKAVAGNALALHFHNANAAARYLQLHNKATAPVATDVPLYSWIVPAGTADNPGILILDHAWFCMSGGYFSTGLGWAVSTTQATFTDAATANEHALHLHYK